MNLANCSMTYKLTKSEYFRSILITFVCEDCTLFKWEKNAGYSLQIYLEKNHVKLKYSNTEEVVKSLNKKGESTIELKR